MFKAARCALEPQKDLFSPVLASFASDMDVLKTPPIGYIPLIIPIMVVNALSHQKQVTLRTVPPLKQDVKFTA
jgi:hypothetical protein